MTSPASRVRSPRAARLAAFLLLLAAGSGCAGHNLHYGFSASRKLPVPVRAPAPHNGPGSATDTIQPVMNRTISDRVWKSMATSRGGRSIQGVRTGNGGFRTLVVGSLSGHDPSALALVDTLALQLARNSSITGGITSLVVRTPNPDGAALRRATNAANVNVGIGFPVAGTNRRVTEPEVLFLVDLIKRYQPQRIIHVCSARSGRGAIVHNRPADALALDLGNWLGLPRQPLVNRARPGTLEAWVGHAGPEMITLQMPAGIRPQTALDRFTDVLIASLTPRGQNVPVDGSQPVASEPDTSREARSAKPGGTAGRLVEELPRPPRQRAAADDQR